MAALWLPGDDLEENYCSAQCLDCGLMTGPCSTTPSSSFSRTLYCVLRLSMAAGISSLVEQSMRMTTGRLNSETSTVAIEIFGDLEATLIFHSYMNRFDAQKFSLEQVADFRASSEAGLSTSMQTRHF